MSDNKYRGSAEVIKITAGGTVAIGDVDVLDATNGLIGVALDSGGSGDVIPYGIKGRYVLPKASAAVINAGERVLWDASAGNVDDDQATPASGDFLCGIAMETKGASTTSIEVSINEAPPTVA